MKIIYLMIFVGILSGCAFYKAHSVSNGNMFKSGEPNFNDPRTIAVGKPSLF